MTDLRDLQRRKAIFDADGQKLDIVGLSLRQITTLLGRFDKLDGLATKSLIEVVKNAGADAAGAIIAAAVGKPDDPEYEKFGAELDFGRQVDLIDAIIKITQPQGDGPLAKGLSELVGMFLPIAAAQAAIAAASPISSPSPSPASPENGKDQNKSGT